MLFLADNLKCEYLTKKKKITEICKKSYKQPSDITVVRWRDVESSLQLQLCSLIKNIFFRVEMVMLKGSLHPNRSKNILSRLTEVVSGHADRFGFLLLRFCNIS